MLLFLIFLLLLSYWPGLPFLIFLFFYVSFNFQKCGLGAASTWFGLVFRFLGFCAFSSFPKASIDIAKWLQMFCEKKCSWPYLDTIKELEALERTIQNLSVSQHYLISWININHSTQQQFCALRILAARRQTCSFRRLASTWFRMAAKKLSR